MTVPPRVLVAGVGNVLRGDDGFGPAVVRALEDDGLPEGVRTVEVGIGGMAMILDLLDGFDRLVVIDAVDRKGAPGTLYVLEPDVPEAAGVPEEARGAVADMHQLVPDRMLVLARALGALPPHVRILGCQPGETEELTTDLTPPVAAAVPRALAMLRHLLSDGGEEAFRA